MTLDRGMCFGTCPVYSVTLRRDGSASRHGEAYVSRIGEFVGEVPTGDFVRLARLVERTGFFGWDDEYVEPITDLPEFSLRVEGTEVNKTVVQYASDEPPDFWVISKIVDAIASDVEWAPVAP